MLIHPSVGEGLKSSSSIIDFLKSSGKGGHTPFSMAWGTDKTLWDWYAEPDNAWRFGRFVGAMQNVASLYKDPIFQNGKSSTMGWYGMELSQFLCFSIRLEAPQVY